jgi:hypothetical protein
MTLVAILASGNDMAELSGIVRKIAETVDG